MRRAAVLTAVLVAAVLPASAIAKPTSNNTVVRHYAWHTLTLKDRIAAQRQLVIDDWRIITHWRSSQLEQVRIARHLTTIPKRWSAVSALLPAEPYPIHWRYLHMKWTQRELATSRKLAKSLHEQPPPPTGFPPHHALWMCLSTHGEGGPTSVNPNGHYGMLQMTYNWFRLIKGRASDYPQAVQEWAAETAYRENNYSRLFLYGQWLDYDHEYECLAYA